MIFCWFKQSIKFTLMCMWSFDKSSRAIDLARILKELVSSLAWNVLQDKHFWYYFMIKKCEDKLKKKLSSLQAFIWVTAENNVNLARLAGLNILQNLHLSWKVFWIWRCEKKTSSTFWNKSRGCTKSSCWKLFWGHLFIRLIGAYTKHKTVPYKTVQCKIIHKIM